jgi:hypothetical protein
MGADPVHEQTAKTIENAPDGRTTGIFELDTVLASQYFDRLRQRTGHDGVRRLMVAVLEDAIFAYLKNLGTTHRVQRQILDEAAEWIESRDANWVFSFEAICAALDLEADYLRRGLRARRDDVHRAQVAAREEAWEGRLQQAV